MIQNIILQWNLHLSQKKEKSWTRFQVKETNERADSIFLSTRRTQRCSCLRGRNPSVNSFQIRLYFTPSSFRWEQLRLQPSAHTPEDQAEYIARAYWSDWGRCKSERRDLSPQPCLPSLKLCSSKRNAQSNPHDTCSYSNEQGVLCKCVMLLCMCVHVSVRVR